MAFARFNGYEVPVISAAQGDEIIGDESVAFDGTPMQDRRGVKRVWGLKTKHSTELVAEAIRGMVLGRGDTWSFEGDLYSGKGLAYTGAGTTREAKSSVGSLSVVDASGVAESKFGDYALAVDPGATNMLTSNQATGTDTSSATTGFSAVGGATITSSTAAAMQGSRSLRVAQPLTGKGWEIAAANAPAAAAATAYSAQVHTYSEEVSASVTLTLIAVDAGGADLSTIATATITPNGGTAWQRIILKGTTPALTAKIRLKAVAAADFDTLVDLYTDKLQIETGTKATSWVNGTRAAPSAGLLYAPFTNDHPDLTVAFWAKSPSGTANSATSFFFASYGTGANGALFATRSAGANTLSIASVDASGSSAVAVSQTSAFDGAWHHWAITLRRNPEGTEKTLALYKDGALVQSTTSAHTVPVHLFNRLYLGGDSSNSGQLTDGTLMDDLVVVPWAAPAEQVAAWYALGVAMPVIPRFYLDGDIMPDATLTTLVEGRDHGAEYVRAQSGSSWKTNQRRQSFKLREV